MSLGAKINLTIAAVTIAVLFVTFGIILSMEASSIKNATLHSVLFCSLLNRLHGTIHARRTQERTD